MTGYLQVVATTSSSSLSSMWPFTVRNAQLAVIHRGRSGGELVPLEPGLYSVDAVLPEGSASSVVVDIESDTTHTIDLAKLEPPATMPPLAARLGLSDYHREPPTEMELAARGYQFEVLHEVGCRRIGGNEKREIRTALAPAKTGNVDPSRVPVVTVRWVGRIMSMSVPINPRGADIMDRLCVLEVVSEAGMPRLRMTFSPERAVSRAIEGLMKHRTADEVDGDDLGASLMLYNKYSDPAGAALGALSLYAMGRIQGRGAWVENLARDFPWIPDGRIVNAAQLSLSPDAEIRQYALSMLLDACLERPMYTDGLSLGLKMLRQWPDDIERSQRGKRVEFLGSLAANADWHSLNLTTYLDNES